MNSVFQDMNFVDYKELISRKNKESGLKAIFTRFVIIILV